MSSRGHVFKRGKKWAFSLHLGYDSEGKRKRHQAGGFATKGEADDALDEVIHRRKSKTYVSPSRQSLEMFLIEEWLPAVEGRDLKTSTISSYEQTVRKYIVPELGSIRLQDLGGPNINRFYAKLAKSGRLQPGKRPEANKGLAPKTVRNVHVILRKALSDAVRWNLIPRNPCDDADPPKVRGASRHRMKTWTPEQVRTFLEAMKEDRLFPAYLLSVSTGLRRGEVLGLRWEDVELESVRAIDGTTISPHLSVRQTLLSIDYRELEFSGPKNGREREVSLDSNTVSVLKEWKKRQLEERLAFGELYDRKHDLVFTKVEGGPLHPDFYSQTFDRRVAKLDLPRITLHDLRHSHATIALQAGVHPKIVSERLGHATVAFTLDVYSHSIRGMQTDAAELIAGLVSGSSEGLR